MPTEKISSGKRVNKISYEHFKKDLVHLLYKHRICEKIGVPEYLFANLLKEFIISFTNMANEVKNSDDFEERNNIRKPHRDDGNYLLTRVEKYENEY